MSENVPGLWDYIYKFPTSGLATALGGFAALQQAGLLGGASLPANMLGSMRDINGNVVSDPTLMAWRGDPGRAAVSYTDPNGNTATISAAGDPTQYYVAIRSSDPPSVIAASGIDPSSFGLTVCDPTENAAVLGVWS